LSALIGGWLGGILAQQAFRHKTKKRAFQIPYFTATGINICAILAYMYAIRRGRISNTMVSSVLLRGRRV
jgi:uncharacterized membrane protein YsdA (DUF1294 family)